jgi:hypothetical protein
MARRILDSIMYMTLATADEQGRRRAWPSSGGSSAPRPSPCTAAESRSRARRRARRRARTGSTAILPGSLLGSASRSLTSSSGSGLSAPRQEKRASPRVSRPTLVGRRRARFAELSSDDFGVAGTGGAPKDVSRRGGRRKRPHHTPLGNHDRAPSRTARARPRSHRRTPRSGIRIPSTKGPPRARSSPLIRRRGPRSCRSGVAYLTVDDVGGASTRCSYRPSHFAVDAQISD